MGRGQRTPRASLPPSGSTAALHEAYYRGATTVRQELDFVLERLDEVIAFVNRSPDLSTAQRARLSGMLLRVRTGYRGPLED